MANGRDIAVAAAGALIIALVALTEWPGELLGTAQDRLTTGFFFMVSITSILLVAVLFALEYWKPARPEERGFHPSVAFDALYLLVQLPIVATLVVVISQPALSLLESHASFLVLDIGGDLPLPVLLVAGVAIADFTLWVSHIVRHKVPFLWRFHVIHHSQSRLNLFTASRDHPLDNFFETLIRIVPLFILFPSVVENAQALALYGLGVSWHIRFTHTNIATNLGPLRWVLVTPQSHRVHHSIEAEHWNSNYANIFCWDRLVGLQCSDDVTYPRTGVLGDAFPEPETFSPFEFVRCYCAQLTFPFNTRAVRQATLQQDRLTSTTNQKAH